MLTPEQEKTLDALAKDFDEKSCACYDSLLALEKAMVDTGDKEAKKAAASFKFFKQVMGSVVADIKARKQGGKKC